MRGRRFPRNWVCFKNRFGSKRQRRLLGLGVLSLVVLLCSWLVINTVRLQAAASRPVDAFFVLGVGIEREIYVAQLAKQHPETLILISQGSEDPCILLVFQREKAPIRQVWLEKCAYSTFYNFYFNIPLLKQGGVRKVMLITSNTHLPRAKWMAQILLGAHGIWVESDIVQEQGIPGNRESALKTGLDITRSLGWAVFSQIIQPKCSKLVPLSVVNMEAWRNSSFRCERQKELNLY
jgi:uncharacterized SAM-binding protein YcdF (DUF218 family)